jgi:cell division protein FtsA
MESFSCLTEDDKNIGASVINFGANSTSLITFKNGCLVSCLNINLGSSFLTFDLAHAFGISLFEAEKIKIKYGTFLPLSNENYYENIIINNDEYKEGIVSSSNITNNHEDTLINKYDFLSVLIARQEEIIELLNGKSKYLNQIISDRKLILTGGGAK